MSDNPFIDPENPTGEWNMPYEEVTGGPIQANVKGFIADNVTIKVATSDTPFGRLPVLVFDFTNSAAQPHEQMPSVIFVSTPAVMKNIASLVQKSVVAACKAVRP